MHHTIDSIIHCYTDIVIALVFVGMRYITEGCIGGGNNKWCSVVAPIYNITGNGASANSATNGNRPTGCIKHRSIKLYGVANQIRTSNRAIGYCY